MKEFSISELARIVGADIRINSDEVFAGLSTDTRTIGRGQCFVAIKGENFDGHEYVKLAFEKGATCAIVNSDFNGPVGGVLIKVRDPIVAMGQLAREYRQRMGAKVIGITGSAGKTTTRQMSYHVLSKFFKCHAAIKSFNNNIGVPLTILGMDEADEVAIIELGSNHPGEIEYLSRIAQPDVAVVVNALEAHIENFGSVAAIIKEKVSIAAGLRQSGVLIVNDDSEGLAEYCLASGFNYTTFGKSRHADISASNIKVDAFSSEFWIEGQLVKLAVPGKGNIDNALAAWAICKSVGISAGQFAEAIADFAGVAMRLEQIQLGQMLVISDCYNANPASMRNAVELLETIGKAQKNRRTVFICGQMLELGEHSDRLHIELGMRIGGGGVGMVMASGRWGQVVAEAAREASAGEIEAYCFENTGELCNKLSNLLRNDDIILVKGSRGARLEAAVEKIKELFGSK